MAPALVNHAMGGAFDSDSWREADKALLPGWFPDLVVEILDQ
jgi:hypothetical protein